MRTITRAEIITHVMEEGRLVRHQTAKFVEDTLDIIAESLADEGSVKISSFGSFTVRHKPKRIGRNPKTREEAVITPRQVVSFKPSQYLKEKIQKQG